MEVIDRYRIDSDDALDGSDFGRLTCADQHWTVSLPARDLEGQFATQEGDLLVTTLDRPRQEVLRFWLIGRHGQILDHCQYTGWYQSFMVRDLSALDENSLGVVLSGGTRLRVTVASKRRWRRLFRRSPELELALWR
ncbi:MAG: hypothetical protein ACQES2_01130 [Pseudomonadota bacterium]